MKNRLLNHWALRLTLLGCLVAIPAKFAPAAFASPTAATQTAKLKTSQGEVQPLTCVHDSQGLMCTTDLETPVKTPNSDKMAETFLSSRQLEQISNALLILLYFAFPAGLVLSILLHDKNDAYRTQLLNTQIEALEKIWKRNSNPNSFEN